MCVGQVGALLLGGAVLVEHRHAHPVTNDELTVHHSVVAFYLTPDFFVGQAVAAAAVLLRKGNAGEAGAGSGSKKCLLVVKRGDCISRFYGVSVHEVDAFLAELSGCLQG